MAKEARSCRGTALPCPYVSDGKRGAIGLQHPDKPPGTKLGGLFIGSKDQVFRVNQVETLAGQGKYVKRVKRPQTHTRQGFNS
jgi:hypothetical protein